MSYNGDDLEINARLLRNEKRTRITHVTVVLLVLSAPQHIHVCPEFETTNDTMREESQRRRYGNFHVLNRAAALVEAVSLDRISEIISESWVVNNMHKSAFLDARFCYTHVVVVVPVILALV